MTIKEKGRRYVLQANINDLQKKFKEASKIIKDNAQDLRALNRYLKFDTNNIDTMAAKWLNVKNSMRANEEAIKNIKQQMQYVYELEGKSTKFEKFRVQLAEAEARAKSLKKEFVDIDSKLNGASFFKKFDKFSSDINEARGNAKKLDEALRLDPKNFTIISSKLSEMKREYLALNENAKLLNTHIKTLDPKLHPEKVRAFRSELELVKAQAKALTTEMKELAVQKFSMTTNSVESLSKAISKSTENVRELNAIMKGGGNNRLVSEARFTELNNVVAKSKEKVRLLKAELRNIDPKVNINEFVRLNRELNNAEKNARELVSQLNLVDRVRLGGLSSAFNTTQERLNKLGSSMQSFGHTYSLAFTLPMAYASKRMVDEFRETDDGIRRVASAGASEIQGGFTVAFDMVRNSAKAVSKDSVYSIKEVAGGMEQLVKAGWNVSDATAQVAHVMNAAKVEGMDLAAASEIVTDGLSSFGLAAKDTQRFVDVLTQTSIDSTTDITKMGETFKYVAPIAGQLGFTIEDVGLAIGIMANNGIKASVAGTSLRGGLANLVKPSAAAKKVLDDIGFSMVDSSGKTKSLATVINELREKTAHMTDTQKVNFATTVFGKTAMSGWSAILKATDENVNKLSNSINNSTGATSRMAEQLTEGIGGSIDKFKAKISNASESFGRNLEPAMKSTLGVLGSLVDSFGNASAGTQQFIAGITGTAMAIPPLTWAIGGAIKQYSVFMGLFTSPLALPIAGTVALTGAMAYAGQKLVENTEWYKRSKEASDRYSNSVVKLDVNMQGLSLKMQKNNDVMNNTVPIFERLYGASSNMSRQFSSTTNEIESLFSEMQSLFETHNANMQGLSGNALSSFSNFNSEYIKLTDERINNMDNMFSRLSTLADDFVKSEKLSDDELLVIKASNLKQLSELKKQAKEIALQDFERQKEINRQLPENERKTNAELEKAYSERVKKIDEMSSEILDKLNSRVNEYAKNNATALKNFSEHSKNIEDEEKRHQKAMEDIENANMKFQEKEELREKERREHETNLNNHRSNLIDAYNAMNQDQMDMWITSIATQVREGGNLTKEQSEFVKSYIAAMDKLPDEVKQKFEKAFSEAGISIDELKESIKDKMETAGSESIDSLESGMDIKAFSPIAKMEEIMNKSKEKVDGTDMQGAGSSATDRLANGIISKDTDVISNMQKIIDSSRGKVSEADFRQDGIGAMNKLQGGISGKSGDVSNATRNVVTNARSGASSISFSSVGQGIVSGIASGASSVASTLYSTLTSIASSALTAAKNFLGINSPSRKFRDMIGQHIPTGIAWGIEQKSGEVNSSLKNLANGMVSEMSSYNLGETLSDTFDYGFVSNASMEYEAKQNSSVIGVLNDVVEKLNKLELVSHVYLDSEKLGEITYKEHMEIERRYSY